MQKLVQDRGLEDQIQIDSAGTIGYHQGNQADSRMMTHARRRGYILESRSRKIVASDLKEFDLVIAMDRQNQTDILEIDSEASNVRLLSDFLNNDWPKDVPDPYYGGADGFETVLDMIETACPEILQYLLDMS